MSKEKLTETKLREIIKEEIDSSNKLEIQELLNDTNSKFIKIRSKLKKIDKTAYSDFNKIFSNITTDMAKFEKKYL